MNLSKKLIALAVAFSLTGCATTGEKFQADVFDSSMVNTQQEAKTVTILSVSPAKVKVSNKENQQKAQLIGGILGAAAGAAIGNGGNRNKAGVGALAGGAAGVAAGSIVESEVLVDGVLLGYSLNGKIYTSTQVGRTCQFEKGQVALMVTMLTNETRIQPNGTCPVEPAK